MYNIELGTDSWEVEEEAPTMDTLNTRVLTWLQNRNLIEGSSSKDQLCKLVQEVGEVSDAICKGERGNLESEIGDCIVVLTAIAAQNGLSLHRCLATAHNKIKDRKGVMKHGIFIKEEDLEAT